MLKRYGAPPKGAIKYTRRPGTYVVLPIGQGILLTHQNGEADEFQLPGGGIDPGEHPIPALHREVLEETGWIISRPTKLGAYKRFIYMPEYELWAEKICHIYVARPCYRLCDPIEIDHTDHILSVPLALEVMANDGDRDFVRAYLGY